MRKRIDDNGFTLWLSKNDTYDWAHRSGESWPCSDLSGKRCRIDFDSNGLCDFTVNGRDGADVPSDELSAIVADHIWSHLPDGHPGRFVLTDPLQPKGAKYNDEGMRLTDCCGCLSTFCDETLCCKRCFYPVPLGQGDGNEHVAL
jgi:hypothetical protein